MYTDSIGLMGKEAVRISQNFKREFNQTHVVVGFFLTIVPSDDGFQLGLVLQSSLFRPD